MTWTPRMFGLPARPGFESDCRQYDVVQKADGTWRLIFSNLDERDGLDDWVKDFRTIKAAKAYAEAQA